MNDKYTTQFKSLLGVSIRYIQGRCEKVCYKGDECPLCEKPLYCPADGHILEHAKQAGNIFVELKEDN